MTSLFDQPTPIRAGEEVDTARLEEYLRSHFVDEKGPLEVRQYPSGHSNLTYALRFGGRELGARAFAIDITLDGSDGGERAQSVEDTRIADIADQAGAAIGSFYHHFSGKQAVFTAVLHEHLATLHDTVGTGGGGDGGRDSDDAEARTPAQLRAHAIERVNAAVDRYLDDYPGHTSLLLLRLDEAIGTHPELIELRLAVHRHFASAIATSLRRWQAAGIADATLDADHAGDALAAMVGHATRVWRLFGSPYDRDVASRNLTTLWCNGVGLRNPE